MSGQFIVQGLQKQTFDHLGGLSSAELAAIGVEKILTESKGYPCRVSLRDNEIGEVVFALSYEYHAVNGPFRSRGPIYVRENARPYEPELSRVPAMLESWLLSVRAYDAKHRLVLGEVTPGERVDTVITECFSQNCHTRYIQIHHAQNGCFLCNANRQLPAKRY